MAKKSLTAAEKLKIKNTLPNAESATEAQQQAALLVGESARETPTAPARSGDLVTVCCKLPHGLSLQLQKPYQQEEAGPGGQRIMHTLNGFYGQKYIVAGNALPKGGVPQGDLKNGVAMTPGIPRDFWNAWKEQNKDLDALVNGLIFVADTRDEAFGLAKDAKGIKSGMGPLDMTQVRDPKDKTGQRTVARDPRMGQLSVNGNSMNVNVAGKVNVDEDADIGA